MNIVFAGPTISHSLIRQHLDCVCLPPVSHGDILTALVKPPDAIGIIDGYFEGVPSVWHKEILYAMDQGVRVYGSASMGALRAAELCAFGMVGVGQVFENYRDGLLEDDDEVAVLHGPEEAEYVTASVPMVNIRATLAKAWNQQIISETQKDALMAAAKNTFYKQRGWNRLLDASDALQGDTSTVEKLKHWLTKNKVDQKQADAIEMLELMNERSMDDSIQPESCFHFQWTSVWDVAVRDHEKKQEAVNTLGNDDQKVIDQLRLNAGMYQRYSDKALLIRLSKNGVETQVDEQSLKSSLKQFRADNNLDSRTQLTDYMEKANLDEAGLTILLTNASRVDLAREASVNLEADIIDVLKIDGQYIRLLEMASVKEQG